MPKKTFPQLVADEIASARRKHPRTQSSFHEGYAVILEELDELWAEIKKQGPKRNRAKILGELVQVAAMAQRMAEDRSLVPVEEPRYATIQP